MRTENPSKSSLTSPLFKADKEIRVAFSASDGRIRVNYQGWEDATVVQPGEMFTLRLGPQWLEGRIEADTHAVPKGGKV